MRTTPSLPQKKVCPLCLLHCEDIWLQLFCASHSSLLALQGVTTSWTAR